MPNWVENTLTIKGNSKEIERFLNEIGDEFEVNFRMEKLMPIPEEFTKTDLINYLEPISSKNGKGHYVQSRNTDINKNGLNKNDFLKMVGVIIKQVTNTNRDYRADEQDWCEHNWGCKWDMIEVKVYSKTDTEIIVSYLTPNGQNDGFIYYLSQIYPCLEFELLYTEGGCGDAGSYTVKNGLVDETVSPLIEVYFAKEKEDDKYRFFTKWDEAKKYPMFYFVSIPVYKFEIICKVNGYTSENVINWNDLISLERYVS